MKFQYHLTTTVAILVAALFLLPSLSFGQLNQQQLDSINRAADERHDFSEANDLPTTQKKYRPKWRFRPDKGQGLRSAGLSLGFDYAFRFSGGGFFTDQFGDPIDDQVSFDVSVNVAARPIRFIELGVQPYYQFTYFDYDLLGRLAETNVFGVRLFNRIYLYDYVFIQTSYMLASADHFTFFEDGTNIIIEGNREISHHALFGPGLNIPVGDHAQLQFSALWNLTTDNLYLYRNPFISFGFGWRL